MIHQLPPEPAYLRVKVRRRLHRLGAIALKNSVYALPLSDDALEDFQWLRRDVERDGGSVTICEAAFTDGATDARLVAESRAARAADYREVAESARGLLGHAARADEQTLAGLRAKTNKLERRLEEVIELDFFDEPRRQAAQSALRRLKDEIHATTEPRTADLAVPEHALGTGRTWVTRVGIKVDRIASAWLIKRFIDPAGRFKFVPAHGYEPAERELRFDMFDGDYTHVGDACTFETLLTEFELTDPALVTLGQIIHDIDCKDDKYGRGEVAGVASLINGIIRAHNDDGARLERGVAVLDDLFEHFRTVTS